MVYKGMIGQKMNKITYDNVVIVVDEQLQLYTGWLSDWFYVSDVFNDDPQSIKAVGSVCSINLKIGTNSTSRRLDIRIQNSQDKINTYDYNIGLVYITASEKFVSYRFRIPAGYNRLIFDMYPVTLPTTDLSVLCEISSMEDVCMD